ncbi:two-component system, chemotaxis family, sensor kinase CheA [Palleronia marisminoris]|uniref:Chemotaxis protein CheA n=1 Tax=Palleronia marisminoris TaxID=315423 RepID=A0A1Y5RBK2_9RHOB|nr:chemotaxis protein CheA [Palleronia marisminoris]SFG07195.1 two-component system, chemotaxis family, sensor kinase CheA [Palleronia marisminoris]SLN11103.1 Chemotaxis protein CheA [Palleronia marisminoris]
MNPAAESFVQESRDILEDLEGIVLELEADPSDPKRIDAVFRALHTLKGSGGMFGFATLAAFTHHFESAYERIREGKAAVTPELIQLSLASRDHLERMLDAGPDEDGTPATDPATAELVAKIEAMDNSSAPVSAKAANCACFTITFKPEPTALRNGMRPELLIAELQELGDATVSVSTVDVPLLRDLDPAVCHLSWMIELETAADRDAIDDVFIFASDWQIDVQQVEAGTGSDLPAPASSRAESVADSSKSDTSDAARGAQKTDSVRVPSHRLDELMDQLGELVIAQARLNRISTDLGDAGLSSTAEEIERLVTGLRDATLSIRMLPIELVFGKFRRVVRDLSTELGKDVQLSTLGGETEVDKNVIDSLTEPLVHIIRNSIDHGIESPEERRAAGKADRATVAMRARQAGGEVLISVTDDGKGLDAEAIRARGIERGLIAADQDISEDQLFGLIFEPGFSTAKALSSVSGRGVGMDAVRRVIDDLHGAVEVKSVKGRGTEVTLRLPLTLAIIDGLLVKVAGGPFVLPLSNVEECVELPCDENERQSGRSILRIRDQLVPFLSLDTLFGFDRIESSERRVVITSVEGRRTGLVVDEVIGQYQTVIKPLSLYHRGIEGLAGSTILGDGAVALILDAAAIVRRAQNALKSAA